MAILANSSLDSHEPLVDFDHLALGTHNNTHNIIASKVTDSEYLFAITYEKYQHAMRKKTEEVLRTGASSAQTEKDFVDAYNAYQNLKQQLSHNESLDFLDKPIHRKEFKVKPYKVAVPGKIMPPQPYLGANSGMDGIWPGYDKPEYFEQYPFLASYNVRAPGKALQAFLDEHNLLFHFPETVSRYGVLFVPPPYLDDDMHVALRQHLSKSDPLYHTAATVSESTTAAEARLVLSYLEDDMPAVVVDSGGSAIGVLQWDDLHQTKDTATIQGIYKKDFHQAPQGKMEPIDAFLYMELRDIPFMIQHSPHGYRVVTQTTAAISHFLPPHLYGSGLGSALYFGISDVKDGDRLINRINSEADGVPAALVETAHADTPFYRKILGHYRDRLQGIFLMAGTTIDPEATLEFLETYGADGVKLGIAEGRACRTSKTGVSIPNAHVGLECGAAAFDRGYLMLDGWGQPDEFILGLAMSGIQMRQGGGAFVGRREAANPSIKVDGTRGKYYRGMAGADVQAGVLQKKSSSPEKRMEEAAHLHSEGAEVFVPLRSPSTVGRWLLSQQFLLMSAMSYQGVRAELQENVLRQFQRLAKLYRL